MAASNWSFFTWCPIKSTASKTEVTDENNTELANNLTRQFQFRKITTKGRRYNSLLNFNDSEETYY